MAKIDMLLCLGGLHIEIAAFNALKEFLDESGWVNALINVDIGSSGSEFCESCEILDGAVVVQMLHSKTSSTFKDYVQTVFVPYVLGQLQSAQRIDSVWDTYKPDSLRREKREERL